MILLVVEVHKPRVMIADVVVVAVIPADSMLVKKMKFHVGVQSQQSSGQCKRRGQIREESFIVVLNSKVNSVVTSSGQRMFRTQVVEEVVVVVKVIEEVVVVLKVVEEVVVVLKVVEEVVVVLKFVKEVVVVLKMVEEVVVVLKVEEKAVVVLKVKTKLKKSQKL